MNDVTDRLSGADKRSERRARDAISREMSTTRVHVFMGKRRCVYVHDVTT